VSDCLFCRIVAGEIPATVVQQTDRALAFRDINPVAPTHVLVIPKEHYRNAGALAAGDADLLGEVLRLAHAVAEEEGLISRDVSGDDVEPGYRLVANTGPQAGQSVDHVHFHVLGGRSMGWPPWPPH
jgi:histidine triad (HIT) family protein